MKWPFVSRERFEDERARNEELKAEIRQLREVLIPQLRQAPAATPLLAENSDLSKIQPIPGKPTLAVVIAAANKAAYDRSRTIGARSITEDLAEAQAHMARLKREVNGN
jgi:hypothetical protein